MKRVQWFSVIRTLGLVLVLTYHLFQALLPGGFIGVDVFFTFSGYLMTAMMIEGFAKSGDAPFFSFIKKRFIRIFPPLLIAILVTLPLALLLAPDYTAGIARQVAASLGFVTNYFEILTGGSYEAGTLPHLYLHTWTLAVEVHFYIVWGAICSAIAFLIKKCPAKNGEDKEKRVAFFRIVTCSLSLIFAALAFFRLQTAFIQNPQDPSAAYFGTDSHGFTFLLGAAAGAVFGIRPKESRVSRGIPLAVSIFGMVLSVAGIVTLALVLGFASKVTYQYGFLAVSLLTIVIVRAILGLNGAAKDPRELRVLTVISDISYCAYLFHWPIYIVLNTLFQNAVLTAALTLSLTGALSAVVFYVIEPMIARFASKKPVLGRPTRKPIKALIAFMLSVTLILAVFLSGTVMSRAPEMSSLEQSVLMGHIYQDADSIAALKRAGERFNGQPMTFYRPLPLGSKGTTVIQLPPPTSDILPGVTIIGDSVCLGARKNLIDSIEDCYVDAEESRSMGAGRGIITNLRNSDRLREYVVVALGTNDGSPSALNHIDKIIDELPSGHRLIFVTPFDGRATPDWYSYKIGVYERTLPEIHPFVTVADWAELIKGDIRFLGPDKIHLSGITATRMYTNCIISAINDASRKSAKP